MFDVYTYERVKQSFANEKCVLLDTPQEFMEIRKKSKSNYKYNYIASCGHQHIVYHHVFLSRKTGVICPDCALLRNKDVMKKKMQDDKTLFIQLEYDCIQYFKELLNDNFDVIKAFDCCKSDVILKPRVITENKWIGIQFKTTKKSNRGYGFCLGKDYTGYLILCMCKEDKRMWAIPYEDVSGMIKIAIGNSKSKYDKYEITKETISNKMFEFYNSTNQTEFDILNTPQNIYQQREQEFRKFREENVDFLTFVDSGMEGTVSDFVIEDTLFNFGIKVQEKVGCYTDDGRIMFGVCKNDNDNKTSNHKTNKQYDIGDNDIYWLNCTDKKYFYVFPEDVLIEKGYVGTTTNKTYNIKLPKIENQIKKPDYWTNPYLFNYENIDKDRLLNIIDEVSEKLCEKTI